MSGSESGKPRGDDYRTMTVAQIREETGADPVQVIFLESARFYTLLRTNPQFDAFLQRLRDAMTKGRGVQVRMTSPHGDIIEDIQELVS